MIGDQPSIPPGTVIKTTILAHIRDPAGRTWRDKGHAWDRGHARKVLAACGAPAHHYEHGPTGHVQIRVPPGTDPDRLIERMRKHAHVANVEFDQTAATCDVVSNYTPDPCQDTVKDKGYHRIDLFGAFRYGFCSPSVRIASVDTGIMPHEDLNVAPENSWSCLGGVVAGNGDATVPFALNGAPHGLMTIGCFAALPNGKGVIGTAAGCTPIAIRVAPPDGSLAASDIVAGLYQAGAAGAHIVTVSLVSQWTSQNAGDAGPTALQWLISQGIVVLGAAGNGNLPTWLEGCPPNGHSYAILRNAAGQYEGPPAYNSPTDFWPGGVEGVAPISSFGTYIHNKTVPGDFFWNPDVRGVWFTSTYDSFTNPPLQTPYQPNRGPRIVVVAPDGINVLVGSWSGSNQYVPSTSYSAGGMSGTSFATPISAGVCGLILTENPALNNQQVLDILRLSADAPIYPDGNAAPGTNSVTYPPVPWTNHFPNAGILNAARARLMSWTTNPVNAGLVRAYLHVIDDVNNTGVTYDGPTTTINGPCFIDVDGYSSDPITSVELWIGGLRLYSGAAKRFYATGSTSGPAHRLRIVAKTAGAVADDTRSDIVVSTLTCPDFDPVGIASVTMTAPQTYLVTGKMHAGTTVALDGAGGTVSDITYTDSTSWQATVSSVLVDPATLTATTSDGVVATATTEGPGEFTAPVTFDAAIDSAYSVYGDSLSVSHRLAASQNAIWDPPQEGSLIYDAANDAQLDAGYAESTDAPAFDAQPGANLDAEWQPQLAPSWLARVVMSGLSWVAGPFAPFVLNPETALTMRAGFGASSDAWVDYSTYNGFGARIGATVDAAFGEAFRDGAAFPWTASAAFDADFSAAPPREADTDLWPRVVPLGLAAKSRRVGIVAHAHPVNLEARHG